MLNLHVLGQPIDSIMKHKGLRPSVTTDKILNPTTMAEMIEQDEVLYVDQRLMCRDKKKGGVQSKHVKKRIRVTMSKRMWPEKVDGPTLPIGSKLIV